MENNNQLDCMGKINAYLFKYKPEVRKEMDGSFGVDDKPHIGVMAQELQANPATESTVERDPNDGYLKVNTEQLTMTNTAAIAELTDRKSTRLNSSHQIISYAVF